MIYVWLLVAIAVGVGVLVFVSVMSKKENQLNTEEYRKRWEKIQAYLSNQETYGIAILEADKLLDKALKESRFKGQTMAERMVSAKKVLSKKDQVWMAHKLRNKIAHETDIEVSRKHAQGSLAAFYRALKDLGAI